MRRFFIVLLHSKTHSQQKWIFNRTNEKYITYTVAQIHYSKRTTMFTIRIIIIIIILSLQFYT